MLRLRALLLATATFVAWGAPAHALPVCNAAGVAPEGAARKILLWSLPDAAWAERARGQLSDLDVGLSALAPGADTASPPVLSELERGTDADVVVWLTGEAPSGADTEFVVHVWTRSQARAFEQTLEATQLQQETLEQSHSALLEAAALYVRGVVKAELSACNEPLPTKVDASTILDNSPAATEQSFHFEAAPHASYRAFASNAIGAFAAGGSLGVTYSQLRVQVGAEYEFSHKQPLTGGDLHFKGYRAFAKGVFHLWHGAAFSVGPGLELGFESLERHTTANDGSLLATPSATRRSGYIGAGLNGSLQLLERQGLNLSAGALFHFPTRKYQILSATSADQLTVQQWPLDVALRLSWFISFI